MSYDARQSLLLYTTMSTCVPVRPVFDLLLSYDIETLLLQHHDWFTAALTFGLCCGLVISYVPQVSLFERSIHIPSPQSMFISTTESFPVALQKD